MLEVGALLFPYLWSTIFATTKDIHYLHFVGLLFLSIFMGSLVYCKDPSWEHSQNRIGRVKC
jgi:hypothetical protein